MISVIVSLLLLSLDAQVAARIVPRQIDESNLRYLQDLYNRFLPVFRDNRPTRNARQFAVLTVNRPNDLLPCELIINPTTESILPSANYLAYTTQTVFDNDSFQTCHLHSEFLLATNFQHLQYNGLNVVHLVSHYSPCQQCLDDLWVYIMEWNTPPHHSPAVQFYIGYVEEYHNNNNPGFNAESYVSSWNLNNVHVAQITSTSAVCRGSSRRRRSQTCPVHCSSGGNSGGSSGSGKGCFPSNALVHINSNASVSMKMMKDLQVGDKVLSVNGFGQVVYSPIIAFLDRIPAAETTFIAVKTENNQQLFLTPTHLLYTNVSDKLLFASEVRPGNYVFVLNQSTVKLTKVIQVDKISAVGMYAPLTEEGNLIVDNVLASCYADYTAKQSFIHMLFAPLRFFHHIHILKITDNQTSEGVHWYARTLMHIHEYL